MPTYGYRCTVCDHKFERVQKITDAALTECESCGGAVKKMLYPVGIAFKGTGFYVTDYKGSGSEKKSSGGGKTDSDSSSTSEAKSDSSGEAKTETKTESKPEAVKPTAS
jgi:putative FmdB family regulatory protein